MFCVPAGVLTVPIYAYLIRAVLDLPRGALLPIRASIFTFYVQIELVLSERTAHEEVQLYPAQQFSGARSAGGKGNDYTARGN